MTQTLTPTTEADLVALVTHLRCSTCQTVREVDPDMLEDVADVDELGLFEIQCGCDDPLAEGEILSDRPLFGRADVDDDYEIPAAPGRPARWSYTVDHMLADLLGVKP